MVHLEGGDPQHVTSDPQYVMFSPRQWQGKPELGLRMPAIHLQSEDMCDCGFPRRQMSLVSLPCHSPGSTPPSAERGEV